MELSTPESLSHLLAQRDITICNLLDEHRVCIIEHDVEVLHSMNRLQPSPVLEPDNLFFVSTEQQ
jgi:hypothetical protein